MKMVVLLLIGQKEKGVLMKMIETRVAAVIEEVIGMLIVNGQE